jgi:hypothetical protein
VLVTTEVSKLLLQRRDMYPSMMNTPSVQLVTLGLEMEQRIIMLDVVSMVKNVKEKMVAEAASTVVMVVQ